MRAKSVKPSSIKIELVVDIETLKDVIDESKELNDNQEMFDKLVEVYRVKKQVGDILDQIISIETDVKGWIKSKANALYGNEWRAIKGNGYKISKSPTGSVFNIIPDSEPPKEFVVVKESLDTALVENFIRETGKLPKGIEYNVSRGSSIRVSVDV